MAAVEEPGELVTPLLVALRDLLSELPSQLPELDTHELEIFGAVKVVGGVLARALGLLRSIEDATHGPDPEAVEPDAWESSTAKSASVADVCFGGTLELRRVQRELTSARTPTDQVIALDAVIRKLRRAVRAVLETARDVDGIDLLGGVHQGLHKVSAECDARNVASARLLERLGFTREGLLRRHTWIKGEWTDDAHYGLLAEEWLIST